MEEQILKSIDYVAALGWTILGIALVKSIIYPRGITFKLRIWIGENIQDVIIGIIACPIIMQLGNITLNLITVVTGFDMSGIAEFLDKYHLDPIKLALVLSMILQWKLYKAYRNSKKITNFDKQGIGGDHPDPNKEEK